MMKVRISMSEASATVNFTEEEAMEVYGKLNEMLLNLKKKTCQRVETSKSEPTAHKSKLHIINHEFEKAPEAAKKEIQEAFENTMDSYLKVKGIKGDADTLDAEECKVLPAKMKYRGFMYVKCSECGSIKGFYSKKELDHYHCDNCGARTDFENPLVLLWVNCECGERFRYWTNMTDPAFDVNCLNCGAPVAVQWNEHKGLYETIR